MPNAQTQYEEIKKVISNKRDILVQIHKARMCAGKPRGPHRYSWLCRPLPAIGRSTFWPKVIRGLTIRLALISLTASMQIIALQS